MASNETSKYKLSVVEGTELQLSLNGPQGPIGPANELSIGSVTTVETNVPAAASITGAAPSQILNLILPKGNTGATGSDALWNFRGAYQSLFTLTSLRITGELTAPDGITPVVFDDLVYDGPFNGKPSYRSNNQVCYWQVPSNAWVIYYNETTPFYAAWYSFQTVSDPELVTSWNPATSELGTPVLTVLQGSGNVDFEIGDVVTYGGETWYCYTAVTITSGSMGYPVIGSPYWQLIAAKGEDGVGGNALPLAGGAMDTGAVITLDTAQDGNDVSTDSEVGGWGFGVEEKQNGTNTGKYVYFDTGGFHVESPEHVYVTATIEGSGTVDTLFTKSIDWNFKPSYEGGGYRLRYSGDQWYMDDLSGGVALLAGLGNEVYPWFASWPYGTTMTPTIGSTHLSNTALTFDNGARLKEGTTIVDGNGGIALKCSVDYELKWEAGRLYTMEQDGFTIRRVDHCRNITPTAADDNSKGFVVGSIWTLDDGSSYECTSAASNNATWIDHFTFTIGDGLIFSPTTDTLSCNTNVARRAGNQTFTGNNNYGTALTGVTTTFFGTQTFHGSRTFEGASGFSNQVELTGQALTNSTSAVTRALGDTRYRGVYSTTSLATQSSSNTLASTLSITLPIGIYELSAFIASSHNSIAGCQIRLGTTHNIKVGLTDNYGRPSVAAFSEAIIAEDYNNANLLAIRSDTGGTAYRRTITGIIEVIIPDTVISLDYAQAVTTPANPSSARARRYIIARPIG